MSLPLGLIAMINGLVISGSCPPLLIAIQRTSLAKDSLNLISVLAAAVTGTPNRGTFSPLLCHSLIPKKV